LWQGGAKLSSAASNLFRKRNTDFLSLSCVRDGLERQLAEFLRQRRGQRTYAEFSRKLGLPPSTLHRLESREQSITLRRLQQVLRRLRVSLAEVFPKEF